MRLRSRRSYPTPPAWAARAPACPLLSTSPVCLARLAPSLCTRTTYLLPLRSPLGASTISSEVWPNTSATSLRSLRAAAPVSSSASITMRPAARCRPPANRSSVDTSAFRQHGLRMVTRLSSSLTSPVIAIAYSPSKICANAPASRRGSWRGVPSATARSASTSLPPSRPAAFSSSGAAALDRAAIGEHDIDRQPRSVVGKHLQMRLRGEPLGLPWLRRQVQRHQPACPGGDQRLRQLAAPAGAESRW